MMSEQKVNFTKLLESLGKEYDISSPLQWGYWLTGVAKPDVEEIKAHFTSEGFVEIASYFEDLDNPPEIIDDKTKFCIMFSFVGVHTADSASNQIDHLENWADSRGYLLSWGVGDLTKR